MKLIINILFINLFFLIESHSQALKKLSLSTKNQVKGVYLTSKLSKSSNDLINVTTTITNTYDENIFKLAYQIEFVGINGRIFSDTIIEIPSFIYNKNEIPEFKNVETEIDGELITYTVYDPEYLMRSKKQFYIEPRRKYTTSISFKKKNVTSLRVKPIWAKFGISTYFAPGF